MKRFMVKGVLATATVVANFAFHIISGLSWDAIASFWCGMCACLFIDIMWRRPRQ